MASGDARDARFDLEARDRTEPGVASARRRLKGLEDEAKKTSKKMSDDLSIVGQVFGAQVEAGLKGVARAGGPVVAGVAVAAAPLIGATISAAVLGSAAGGGIIGGVVLAARDARVQQAGKELNERLLSGLEQDASVLIKPLLDAMGQAYARADDLDRILSRVFGALADDVGPLTTSLLNTVDSIGEGIADAVEGAGPVLRAFGSGLENIGAAIGEGFSQVADNGVAAAQAVTDLTGAIAGTLRVTFDLVDALTTVYGYARAYSEVMSGNVAGGVGIVAAMQLQTQATGPLGEGYSFVAVEAEDAADAIKEVNDALFAAAGAAIGAAEAKLRYADSVKTAREEADGLSKVSADEESALLRQATAANTLVESLIAAGASTDEVAAASQKAQSDFIGTATAMGLTRQRAVELAAQYLAVPTEIRTRVVADSASATAEIERLKARLGEIPAQVNVAIRVTGTDVSRAAVAAGLAKQNFAAAENGFFQAARHAEARFMADGSPAAAGGQPGRVGRAEPISLENTVNVALDGKPFYDMTAAAVSAGQARTSFWRAVGRR